MGHAPSTASGAKYYGVVCDQAIYASMTRIACFRVWGFGSRFKVYGLVVAIFPSFLGGLSHTAP